MKHRSPILLILLCIALAACDTTTTPAADADIVDDGDVDDAEDPDADAEDPDADAEDPDADLEDPDADDLPAYHPARYPTDRTFSPLTPYVADELIEIAAVGPELQDDVFAKLGNSITVSTNFLYCFGGDDIDLDGRDELADTVVYFRGGDAGGGTNPFQRESLSATVGWHAGAALTGDPSPLEQEVDASLPRFAVVMYGTNDIGWANIRGFADNMLDISDNLIGRGVIPLLSSIPPRDDSAAADLQVPRYNNVVRGIAQALQVPFVDFHRELMFLADHGMAGDGVHPNVYYSGGARPCFFTAEGLERGYNIRNLITLETLHRARMVVVEGAPAPDVMGPALLGDGSPEDPFVIETLPFTDLRNTLLSPHRNIDFYTGCDPDLDESGPELTYVLDLVAPTTVRAMVFDRGAVDIDIHLLDETGTAEGCLARDHHEVVYDLEPGRWIFVLDTFVSAEGELAGEYLFLVMEES